MLPWMSGRWGNPSSAHGLGQEAREAVESARDAVAALLGARPLDLVFTASGTEANNAVCATLLGAGGSGGTAVVSAFEHPSVLAACDAWAGVNGVRVTRVAPGRDGVVDPAAFAAALGPDTRLAALMLANNEVGTLQPVAEVARLCRERGVPLLCDAVQAAGKVPLEVDELGVDYLTVGAHKFHGPLGAAALWIRPGAAFEPLLRGGGQERRRRASTVNVPAVVGFGVAAELARAELEPRAAALEALRDRFERGLPAIGEARVHGAGAPRLPHTSSVAFPGLVHVDLMMRLDLAGFAVSTGAACGSGTVEPGPSLAAMGLPRELSTSTIRVSFGVPNTFEEIDRFLPVLAREVAALRTAEPAAT